MPTSSQALILTKSAISRPGSTEGLAKPACSFNQRTTASIAKVYQLTGGVPVQNANIKERVGDYSRGRPTSFSSKVWYDRKTQQLKWEMVQAEPPPPPCGLRGSDSLPGNKAMYRPERSPPRSATGLAEQTGSSKTYVNPFLYEKLVGLGFRRSSLATEKDCVYDSFSGRKTAFPQNPDKSKIRQTTCKSSEVIEPANEPQISGFTVKEMGKNR